MSTIGRILRLVLYMYVATAFAQLTCTLIAWHPVPAEWSTPVKWVGGIILFILWGSLLIAFIDHEPDPKQPNSPDQL